MDNNKMTRKFGRGASFAIVGGVYVLATVIGIAVYCLLPATWIFALRLLIADVAATVVTFIFSLIFKNASVYDPYWSVQPIVITVCFMLFARPTFFKVLLLAAVLFWGIRLTANWAYTFHGLEHEDWRYRMLREKTGRFYPVINFVGIHMVPTLIVYACILPAVAVILSGAEGGPLSYVGLAISFGAATLQLVSDIQMHRFRKKKSGGFIRDGLWKYSRHPNYLGEILMWWGIAVCSVTALGGYYYLLVGAFANTLLFLFVSIPMADQRQSRKSGFEEYKKSTRALFPIRKSGR